MRISDWSSDVCSSDLSDEAQLAVAADEVLEIFAAVIVDRLQRHRADLVIGLRRQHMLRIARQAGGGDEARRYRFGHRIIFVAEIDILGFEIGVGIVVADLGAEPVERLGQEAEARERKGGVWGTSG